MFGKRSFPLWWSLSLFAIVLLLPAESPDEVINPRRASGSYVSDQGGMLAGAYVKMIDAVCHDLAARTGVELAVVTVHDLGDLPIDEFAEKVFRRFGIGAAGKDNGLLLICSRNDRKVRLEVGYGLEAAIPDAKASRLLEGVGLAYLKAGFFGRGLFMTVRDIAGAAAIASGAGMFIAEPTTWPAEAAPATPLAAPVRPGKAGWNPVRSSLGFAAGLLGFALLGLAWTLLRFSLARGRAARGKVIGRIKVPIIVVWTAAVVFFFLILGFGKEFFPPFVAMLAAPGLATTAQLVTSRLLKRRLASYHLPCKVCGEPMTMVDDNQDEPFLTEEQAAEERAGGMDYEFWHCAGCGAGEHLAIRLGRAGKCPQCGRRTLTSSTVTLQVATREEGGKERITETCLNPKCGYRKVRERGTPKVPSPGSPSSGIGRSSSASFGGGRSGGGGASRGF